MRLNIELPYRLNFKSINGILLPKASIIFYNYVLGREAAKPVNQEKQAGRYTVQFNSDGLSSDVYLYRITINNPDSRTAADHLTKTMKFMLLK